jgi:TetR/AcrR family tetracycline transcriptional repressor
MHKIVMGPEWSPGHVTPRPGIQPTELIGRHLVDAGFSLREATVLLSTVYTFTVSLTIGEQAVFPVPGERSPGYDIEKRNARLDARSFPFMRRGGPLLLDQFERRYRESLSLILDGAAAHKR